MKTSIHEDLDGNEAFQLQQHSGKKMCPFTAPKIIL